MNFSNILTMKLSELYKKGIQVGMKYDPRDNGSPNSDLDRVKKEFESLEDEDKKWFDKDLLWNPYPDSRPVCCDAEDPVLYPKGDGRDPEFSKPIIYFS